MVARSEVVGKAITAPNGFRERDTGFEPATFSLGKRTQPFRAVPGSDKQLKTPTVA